MSNKLLIGSGIAIAFFIIMAIGYYNPPPIVGCTTYIHFLYEKDDYENVDRTIREELRKHIDDNDLVDSVYSSIDGQRTDLSKTPKGILFFSGEYSEDSREVTLIKDALAKNPKISNISESATSCVGK